MPEPRETHAAIDARRNTQRGGGGDGLARFSDVVGKDEAARLAEEEREAQRRIQRRRLEIQAERSPEYARMRAQRDALVAIVERVQALCRRWDLSGDPVAWEHADHLRAALDAAPSDPATDTGGEAT